MDRKGSKKQSKNRRKRKRPLNRYEIEQAKGNTSTSAKKLKSVDQDGDTDLTISYRIINFWSIFPVLSEYLSCKTCGTDIEFQETSQRGLGFKLVLKCKKCEVKYIDSCPLISHAYEINRRFIFATRLLGISLQGAERFCALMDLPRPIFQSFYDQVVKQIQTAAKSICDMSLKASVKEEKMKTAEAQDTQKAQDTRRYSQRLKNVQDTTELTVSGNRNWKNSGLASLYGVSILIGFYTNKVIDIVVKSSFCEACSIWENRTNTTEYEEWLESHEDVCTANHEGSSGRMEVNGIREMFLRSEDLHGVKYVNYVSDGDSKTYKAIVDSVPYAVTEKECINHIQERMGARLRWCKKQNMTLGRGTFTGKLIDELSTFYGLAIRRHQNSVDEMYKAIWATLYHKSSSDETPKHHYCPEGPESWCTWQKAKAAGQLSDYKHKTPLSDDVVNAVTPIYTDLSDKRLLENCIDFTQNNNESFNGLLRKFAPNISGAEVVQIAAYLAVCIFNGGYTNILKIMELMGIKIGPTASQYRHREDEHRISSAAKIRAQAMRESRFDEKTHEKQD
ncbi:uncharacterized protein [Temnothorax nylanderi]|uniref:uncharacterized protein n=1 Tax=Temnothorax nylanderi TaxID=102681 RepID=UPI003A865CFC